MSNSDDESDAGKPPVPPIRPGGFGGGPARAPRPRRIRPPAPCHRYARHVTSARLPGGASPQGTPPHGRWAGGSRVLAPPRPIAPRWKRKGRARRFCVDGEALRAAICGRTAGGSDPPHSCARSAGITTLARCVHLSRRATYESVLLLRPCVRPEGGTGLEPAGEGQGSCDSAAASQRLELHRQCGRQRAFRRQRRRGCDRWIYGQYPA